jgi:hypothetical protein
MIVADLAGTLEVIATITLLIGAIGLGVTAFVWARNWRRRTAEETNPEEQIESYRHMLDEGLIEPQEFERIEARLHGAPSEAVRPAAGEASFCERPSPVATEPRTVSGADSSATSIRSGEPPRPTDVREGPPPADPPPSVPPSP